MFELADRLVGIYKTYDCTKSVTISPKLFTNCSNISLSDGGANNTGKITDYKNTQKENDIGTNTNHVLKNSTNLHI